MEDMGRQLQWLDLTVRARVGDEVDDFVVSIDENEMGFADLGVELLHQALESGVEVDDETVLGIALSVLPQPHRQLVRDAPQRPHGGDDDSPRSEVV